MTNEETKQKWDALVSATQYLEDALAELKIQAKVVSQHLSDQGGYNPSVRNVMSDIQQATRQLERI